MLTVYVLIVEQKAAESKSAKPAIFQHRVSSRSRISGDILLLENVFYPPSSCFAEIGTDLRGGKGGLKKGLPPVFPVIYPRDSEPLIFTRLRDCFYSLVLTDFKQTLI